jgi:hypothetical protein
MSDGVTVAGLLLVAGPLLGALGQYDVGLYRSWAAPRDERLAIVAAHPRGWVMVNAGFAVGTLLTAAGLAVLAGSLAIETAPRAVLAAGAVAYAIAGTLWCAILAIRTRTTPALAAMVAAGTPTEPAETLLVDALGGLFATFILTTGAALIAIGVALALGGGVAAAVGWLAALVAALAIGGFIASGDMLPAVLYPPTLLIGIALLLGWS